MNSIIQTVGDSPFTDVIYLYDFIMRIEELTVDEKLLLNYLIGMNEEDDEEYDLEPDYFFDDCRWSEFITPKKLVMITNKLYAKGYLKDKNQSINHRFYKINTNKLLNLYENEV